MKILIAHNRYQGRGGEDAVFEQEEALLLGGGHDVERLTVSNDSIRSIGARIRTTLSTAYNRDGVRCVTDAIDRFRPDVVHVHNFFPLLSPAVVDACRQQRVAVVVTLHNYRTICAGGMLLREGRVCHKCLDSTNLWGVVHSCYRNSLVGSAASAWMIAHHQRNQTWTRPGLRLIALSRFARDTFVSAGFRRDLIDVKPNFLDDPGEPDWTAPREGALYVGRLSPEKGVDLLLQAAAQGGWPLRVAGDGPEYERLRARATSNVRFLGALSRQQVLAEMARARTLVVPSLWYEGFPMVVLEAFSCGTPVVASRLGSLAEIVTHESNGMLSEVGNIGSLDANVNRLLNADAFASRMAMMARSTFRANYTPGTNLKQLEAIYRSAIAAA